MSTRAPVQAGQFYDGTAAACKQHAQRLLDAAQLPDDLPAPLYGGLVPHAGWMFSGQLAAMTLRALAAQTPPQTVVIFGADHCGTAQQGEVYESGAWETPLGQVPVDEPLAQAVIAADDSLRANSDAHAREHSIEVQIPLLQVLWPDCRIIPIAAPPTALSVQIGRSVGKTLAQHAPHAGVIGSTDLTHHGGFRFAAPGGRGRAGAEWTRQNDRNLLDLIEAMATDEIIPEVARHSNACGAGAVAATIAACAELGATRGVCLQYTNSYEIVHQNYPDDPDDTTVGYASVVFA